MVDTTLLGDQVPRGGVLGRLWADRRYRFIALSVVVVLVVTTGWFLWHDGRAETVPEVPGQATSPDQVGLGYLDALADGRAADASAYLTADPGATAFTSDAVLAESATLNPITDIVVLDTEQRGGSGTVTVRYQFGDQRVIDTYDVVRRGKYWKLKGVADGDTSGYVDIDWSREAVRDQLTVNGVTLGPDEPIRLFPGTYQIGTTNPLLTTDDVLVVPALSTDVALITGSLVHGSPYQPSLELTDAGRQQVTQAVHTTIDACLQEAQLVTTCGLRYSPIYLGEDRTPIESSLSWTVSPTSIDITSTRPAVVAQAQADPATYDQVPGLWAYWHKDDFGTVTAAGSVGFTNGERQTYDDLLYYYAVDVSDPDRLVVFLCWLSSSNDARRGS